ncbi:MAG: molybdopterin dehydrogenase [Clostridiales bacterium GWB2_37_7]|nr:MAG: molybdopterin dehydrogenase [Clostridiales bacterium GWB2_37_7]
MVEVYKPQSLKEALELLEFNDCTVFAGGTDLMVKKKQWTGLEPCFDKPVVLISEIDELTEIKRDENYLYIGAACTFSQLIESSLIPEFYKCVFVEMASPSIRNMATIGGNICNSSPAGDCLPLLYALDANLLIQSSCRNFEVPIEDFIIGPGRNILKSGELVTKVKILNSNFNIIKYRKVGARKSTVLSKLSFIGLADMEDKRLHDIRLAFGAVAPTVVRNREIEAEILNMYSMGLVDVQEITGYYSILIRPIDDQRSTAKYRKSSCKRLLEDFIKSLL